MKNFRRNFTKIRLIGREAKIYWNKNLFTGKIINETKNTIEIDSQSGVKVIPKEQASVNITYHDQIIQIDGTQLKGRHEDRIKHRMKRKW